MKLEYDPTIQKYLLDARITTKAKAISALCRQGISPSKSGHAVAAL